MRAMVKRAQAMCDADGRIRWVNHTSLGWRIELGPIKDSDVAIMITPNTKETE